MTLAPLAIATAELMVMPGATIVDRALPPWPLVTRPSSP